MQKDVIIALDFPSRKETLEFLDLFESEERKPFVKVGMELFYREGPDIIREIKERGHKIFLDLKLHDIPNTVEHAMSNLAFLGVDMVNVHAQGTIEMMKAAKKGLDAGFEKYCGDDNYELGDKARPFLIAVTQLTSTSEEDMHNDLLIEKSMVEAVLHYGENAKKAGLDGVVCSPREAEIIHKECGESFMTVTPGIRFEGAKKDDQVRITSPEKAKEIGCDFIVVGRPITKSDDPVKSYKRCLKDFGIELNKELSNTGKTGKCDEVVDENVDENVDSECKTLEGISGEVAKGLLEIKAVFLRPEDPFTWASGIKSPIYCDNRLILTAPHVRDIVEDALAQTIEKEFPDCEVLMGTATAGIAHAAIVGELLNLPMGYVRGSAKDHGRTNRIEGRLEKGSKVVVIEDLISTGGSSIETVEALREAGAEVLGVMSIFTYKMKKSVERFAESKVKAVSLADLDSLVDVAAEGGYINDDDVAKILRFRDNPSDESWMK